MAAVPLSEVTVTASVFVPDMRPVAPTTLTEEVVSLGVATTETAVVPGSK